MERPILFAGPMARAIIEDRKTHTRRILDPQPTAVEYWLHGEPSNKIGICSLRDSRGAGWTLGSGRFKPFYGHPARQIIVGGPTVPADRLWVRENFYCDHCDYQGALTGLPALTGDDLQKYMYYEADGPVYNQIPECEGIPKIKPSIFMPRWASRITLEIVTVWVEKLQEISAEDAIAEGIEKLSHGYRDYSRKLDAQLDPITSYCTLWESINGPGSWNKNPWVIVNEFKPLTKPEYL